LHQLAAELASDAGLSVVPTHDGMVRWVMPNPDDWWSEIVSGVYGACVHPVGGTWDAAHTPRA